MEHEDLREDYELLRTEYNDMRKSVRKWQSVLSNQALKSFLVNFYLMLMGIYKSTLSTLSTSIFTTWSLFRLKSLRICSISWSVFWRKSSSYCLSSSWVSLKNYPHLQFLKLGFLLLSVSLDLGLSITFSFFQPLVPTIYVDHRMRNVLKNLTLVFGLP